MPLDDTVNGLQKITSQNERNTRGRPKKDTDQQVCEYNPQDRDDKGNELAFALPPHLPEHARIRQSHPRDEQDCRQRGERDFLEPKWRGHRHRHHQQPVTHGARLRFSPYAHIHTTADNHAGHGQSADQCRSHVP